MFPLNLELSDSGLLNKNVSQQLGNIWLRGRVLVHFWVFIEVVDVVANSEEFLLIIGASQEDCSDSHNFSRGDF